MFYDGLFVIFLLFKQKPAYELRISDWSSDVGSSVLLASCMVAAQWRQRGLHQWLIDRRIAYGLRHGLRNFAAMVSPYNDASWSNLMRHRLYLREIGRASCRERVCQYV